MTGSGGQCTIVLFGKKGAPKSSIGNIILGDRYGFTHDTELCERRENESYAAINTPDMFGEGNNPDQQIIDCMALSYPGPHISLLVIQDGHDTPEEVGQQVFHLQDTFGEKITANMIVMLPGRVDIIALKRYINQNLKYPLEVLNNSNDLHKKLPKDRKFFKYTYEKYSIDVVLKRNDTLAKKRKAQKMSIDYDGHPGKEFRGTRFRDPSKPQDEMSIDYDGHPGKEFRGTRFRDPSKPQDEMSIDYDGHPGKEFRGTRFRDPSKPQDEMSIDYDGHPGKEFRGTRFRDPSKPHWSSDPVRSQDGLASGSGNSNTGPTNYGQANNASKPSNILNIVLLGQTGTGKSTSGNTILRKKLFPSRASSVPVTKECKVEKMKIEGTEVRVVDTPDFFEDDLKQPTRHVEDCIKHCQTGLSVYLLVIQIGRFTEGEREILKQLEVAFGTIREKTCVLFTNGEDLKDISIDTFIKQADDHLKDIVKCCRDIHVFKNTKKDQQQVMELMEKIFQLLGNDQMSRDFKNCKEKKNTAGGCTVS